MLGRIAIYLSSDKACARRIDFGVQLAKKHNADVVGVYPTNDLIGHYYDASIIPLEARQAMAERHHSQRETTQQRFLESAEAAGVKAMWRMPEGDAEEALALHARYADVLIMSKAEHGERGPIVLPNLPESVIMAAGRPVLMLPNAGSLQTIGRRVLYCWDQRREAARAFSDAAPLLEGCEELVVLEIDRDERLLQERDIQNDDIADYCASKGYPRPRHLVVKSGDIGVGNVILNTASDHGSDLIVMGAYGHSRMRQWVMGGASRTLLSSMTVPVLLAH